MASIKQAYKIEIASPGGDFIVNPTGSIQTWEQVTKVISDVSYQVEDTIIRFSVDWGATPEYMKVYTSDTIGNYVIDGKLNLPKFWQPQQPLEITIDVQSSNEISDYYIKYFLFKIFLALNLSSPGCCDFYHTSSIYLGEEQLEEKLGLSTFMFGEAYQLSVKQAWPSLSTISIEDTWNWIQAANPDFKRLAATNIEKALFALLQVCKDDGNLSNPDKLIWLAHALRYLIHQKQVLVKLCETEYFWFWVIHLSIQKK